MEIAIRNSQRLTRINHQKVKRALKRALNRLALKCHLKILPDEQPFCDLEVSILLVSDLKMRKLNLQYRGIDKTTDVLSFPQLEGDSAVSFNAALGDIVISIPQAKRQAEENGLPFYDELARLLIHGLLHLLGYDHEKNKYQARKMRKMESELTEVLCR